MNSELQHQLIQILAIADEKGYLQTTDLLLNHLIPNQQDKISTNTPTYEGMVAAVRTELFRGGTNKIAAIKLHRTLTNAGLKESKDWVEAMFGV